MNTNDPISYGYSELSLDRSRTELMDSFYMALPVHLLEILRAVVARITLMIIWTGWKLWRRLLFEEYFFELFFASLLTCFWEFYGINR